MPWATNSGSQIAGETGARNTRPVVAAPTAPTWLAACSQPLRSDLALRVLSRSRRTTFRPSRAIQSSMATWAPSGKFDARLRAELERGQARGRVGGHLKLAVPRLATRSVFAKEPGVGAGDGGDVEGPGARPAFD